MFVSMVIYLTFVNPINALLVTIYIIPFLKLGFTLGSFQVSPGDVLLVLGGASYFVKEVFLSREKPHSIPSISFLLLFSGFSVISAFGGYSPVEADLLQTLGFLILIPLYICNIVKSITDIDRCLNAIIGSGVISAILIILESQTSSTRAYGVLGEPNTSGAFLVLSMAIALAKLVFEKHQVKKLFFFGANILLVYASILTSSRGSWLGIAGLILALSIFLRPGLILQTYGAMLLSFFTLQQFIPEEFWTRLSTVDQTDNENLGMRPRQFESAFEVIRREPLFGSGVGNLYFYTYMLKDEVPNIFFVGLVHNLFLQIAAERGLPAFLFFCFYLINGLVISKRLFKEFASHQGFQTLFLGVFLAIVGFILVNQSAVFLFRGPGGLMGVIWGLFAGAIVIKDSYLNQEEQTQDKNPAPSLLTIPT